MGSLKKLLIGSAEAGAKKANTKTNTRSGGGLLFKILKKGDGNKKGQPSSSQVEKPQVQRKKYKKRKHKHKHKHKHKDNENRRPTPPPTPIPEDFYDQSPEDDVPQVIHLPSGVTNHTDFAKESTRNIPLPPIAKHKKKRVSKTAKKTKSQPTDANLKGKKEAVLVQATKQVEKSSSKKLSDQHDAAAKINHRDVSKEKVKVPHLSSLLARGEPNPNESGSRAKNSTTKRPRSTQTAGRKGTTSPSTKHTKRAVTPVTVTALKKVQTSKQPTNPSEDRKQPATVKNRNFGSVQEPPKRKRVVQPKMVNRSEASSPLPKQTNRSPTPLTITSLKQQNQRNPVDLVAATKSNANKKQEPPKRQRYGAMLSNTRNVASSPPPKQINRSPIPTPVKASKIASSSVPPHHSLTPPSLPPGSPKSKSSSHVPKQAKRKAAGSPTSVFSFPATGSREQRGPPASATSIPNATSSTAMASTHAATTSRAQVTPSPKGRLSSTNTLQKQPSLPSVKETATRPVKKRSTLRSDLVPQRTSSIFQIDSFGDLHTLSENSETNSAAIVSPFMSIELTLGKGECKKPQKRKVSSKIPQSRSRQNLFTRIMSVRKSASNGPDTKASTTLEQVEEERTPENESSTPKPRRPNLIARIRSVRPAPSGRFERTESQEPVAIDANRRQSKRRSSLALPKIASLLPFPSLANRNRNNYKPMDVKKALKNAPAYKWRVEKMRFNGTFDCVKIGKKETVLGKPIAKGIKKFRSHPEKYVALIFESRMQFAHNTKNNAYTLIHRENTAHLTPMNVSSEGNMTIMISNYQHLEPMPNNSLPVKDRDPYTWDWTFDEERLHSPNKPPILPGRGMGVGDSPNLKIIGDVDPSDVEQGDVGNCWLLSAISALAEFDGAIKKLFRNTKNLDNMPGDAPNKYVITLYDLPTWEEVDIVIDESLCAHPKKKGELLGAKISEDGELWAPYLEKALVAHCGGGWNGIEGGHCTHAWSMMTGCKEQYFILKNYRTGKYHCSAKYDMFTKEWKKLQNLPRHKDTAGLEPIEWPEVGGGGAMGQEISQEELFMKMHAWDEENYIVGASSKGTSPEEIAAGMIRNHCYAVIDAHHDVAGTGIDLFKIRNPWGHGEIEDGMFHDAGPGWEQYPEIKAVLNPVVADDGIFYLTKEEFFKFFDHIYLSASNMTEFKED